MIDELSLAQTQQLRAAQKKRSRVIALLILLWIAGLFALTLVKGHQAENQRLQAAAHDD